MRSSLGSFTFGFLIAFSPAPFVGIGTYAVVQAQTPRVTVAAPAPRPQYGAPLERDYGASGNHDTAPLDEVNFNQQVGEPPTRAAPAAEPMKIETDCARRKRLEAEQKAKQKPPEKPDL